MEIDFLWVGEETKTGDAITCRFTDSQSGQDVVVVVDGGFASDGSRIAEHVRKYYKTSFVDLVVCTHPDDDHIKGLFGVFDELSVGQLAINRPTDYSYTGDSVKSGLVEDLVAAARSQGTAVVPALEGASFFGGALIVAGPSDDFYRSMLREQRRAAGLVASATRGFSQAIRVFFGGDPGETLTDDNGGTTARNNTSVILDLNSEGKRALLTGDAGVPALERAADYLNVSNRGNDWPDFIQVPHHGSRHNLDPAILDRLIGGLVDEGTVRGSAFVSVGTKADDFPRPEIANAFRRRGYPVIATRGQNIWWNEGAPPRWQYGPVEPLGWLVE